MNRTLTIGYTLSLALNLYLLATIIWGAPAPSPPVAIWRVQHDAPTVPAESSPVAPPLPQPSTNDPANPSFAGSGPILRVEIQDASDVFENMQKDGFPQPLIDRAVNIAVAVQLRPVTDEGLRSAAKRLTRWHQTLNPSTDVAIEYAKQRSEILSAIYGDEGQISSEPTGN